MDNDLAFQFYVCSTEKPTYTDLSVEMLPLYLRKEPDMVILWLKICSDRAMRQQIG